MLNLLPRDTVFYDLFEGLAAHAVSTAQHLRRMAQEFPQVSGVIDLIRKEEHDADDLAHRALERLDQTFITPFDREDIHALIGQLDTIVDYIDALAKRVALYHVRAIEPAFLKLSEVLVEATVALSRAVKHLRKTRKLSELQAELIEVHRLENLGDDIHHAAISKLFEGASDALEVLKWKELLDYIENAIDGCEDVTNTLERIVLKNG